MLLETANREARVLLGEREGMTPATPRNLAIVPLDQGAVKFPFNPSGDSGLADYFLLGFNHT